MTASVATSLLLILFCGLLVAGAVQDVISLRISNLISVTVLVVATAAWLFNLDAGWWQHPLSFALTLGLGILLFSLGWLGGGDAKLLAATAMAFDLSGLLRLIPSVFLVGGVIAIVAILVRMVFGSRKPMAERRGLPYGVAIAAGAITAVLLFPDFTAFGGDRAAADYFQDSDWWKKQGNP